MTKTWDGWSNLLGNQATHFVGCTERPSVDNDSDEMIKKSPCRKAKEKYSGGGCP